MYFNFSKKKTNDVSAIVIHSLVAPISQLLFPAKFVGIDLIIIFLLIFFVTLPPLFHFYVKIAKIGITKLIYGQITPKLTV